MKKLLFLAILFTIFSCQSGTEKQKSEQVEVATEVLQATVNISGMHCEMCVASIEKGISGLEGVESVLVSLNDSTAVVSFDNQKVSVSDIEKAVEKRGYTIKKEM